MIINEVHPETDETLVEVVSLNQAQIAQALQDYAEKHCGVKGEVETNLYAVMYTDKDKEKNYFYATISRK